MSKVYAIEWNDLISQTAPNLNQNSTIGSLFSGSGRFPGLIMFFFFISGLALLIYLLFGGFTLLTSGGNPDKVEAGKKTITNAVIGFIIIFTAYWIVQIVGLVLGLESVSEIFSPRPQP